MQKPTYRDVYIACIEAHIVTTMKNSDQDGQMHAYSTSL